MDASNNSNAGVVGRAAETTGNESINFYALTSPIFQRVPAAHPLLPAKVIYEEKLSSYKFQIMFVARERQGT